MSFCTRCGAEVGGARFCGQCGHRVGSDLFARRSRPNAGGGGPRLGGFSEFELGALAYLTPIPAIAFLLVAPFNSSEFLRFHSYQCLALSLVGILLPALSAVLSLFWIVGGMLSVLVQFLLIGLWVLAAYRAWQGEQYRVPVLGDVAMRWAVGRA